MPGSNMPTDASAVPPLGPGLLRVIRESAGPLRGREEEFTQQLQYDLATLIPDLAGLRTEDGWVFCGRMVRALLWTATTDQPAAVIAGSLRQLGAINWREGFPDTQYVSVAHALVRTVRDLSGYEWSTSYGSAWISFFQWIRPHLVAGAQWAAQNAGRRPVADPPASAPQPAAPPPAGGYPAAPPGPDPATPGWPPARPRDLRAARPRRRDGEVELEAVGGLLDDEDDDDGPGITEIMLGMTRNRRQRPPPPG